MFTFSVGCNHVNEPEVVNIENQPEISKMTMKKIDDNLNVFAKSLAKILKDDEIRVELETDIAAADNIEKIVDVSEFLSKERI